MSALFDYLKQELKPTQTDIDEGIDEIQDQEQRWGEERVNLEDQIEFDAKNRDENGDLLKKCENGEI